jgi:hypothetical protein
MVAPPQTTSVIVNNSDVIFDASSRCFIGTSVYATEPQSLMHRCNKPVDKTTRPLPKRCHSTRFLDVCATCEIAIDSNHSPSCRSPSVAVMRYWIISVDVSASHLFVCGVTCLKMSREVGIATVYSKYAS